MSANSTVEKERTAMVNQQSLKEAHRRHSMLYMPRATRYGEAIGSRLCGSGTISAFNAAVTGDMINAAKIAAKNFWLSREFLVVTDCPWEVDDR
jgi:hypothetical protein